MPGPVVDILMYHSISDAGGPTSIPPPVFEIQMDRLAESGVPVVSLDTLADGGLPGRSVVITFDDAFQDFADVAWPVLRKHRFPAIVYVPTDHVGKHEAWRGANRPARPLMTWDTMRALASDGAEFGSHSISHPDLRALAPSDLSEELTASRAMLEERLGTGIAHFAPPYGLTTSDVRRVIALTYRTSVGTRLARASADSNVYDLPRLEMHYFRSEPAWRRHLAGRGGPYLAARQTLRRVREGLSAPWNRT